MDIKQLIVDTYNGGWTLRWPNGDLYDPSMCYKRAQDAKRELTLILKNQKIKPTVIIAMPVHGKHSGR